MCKCTPNIRTPFCGKGDCEWPDKEAITVKNPFVGKIAILGGPGSGKTTLAAGLFRCLKLRRIAVETVPELIKYKVYAGPDFTKPGFDIANTLEQHALEAIFDKALADKMLSIAICEAPLCNGYMYASFYGKDDEIPVLKKIADAAMPTYNRVILVNRGELDYQNLGRLESEAQSNQVHAHIVRRLQHWGIRYTEVSARTEPDEILEKIL